MIGSILLTVTSLISLENVYARKQLFRELFGDELFDIELKNAQRTLKNKEEERGRDLDVLSNQNKAMKI